MPHPAAYAVMLLCPVLAASAVATEESPPSCATQAHSQFDFWVGDWDVYLADGSLAGSNHIEKILASCVVYKNWQSARSNYAGKSFNTFDPAPGTWNQVWVDTSGATIHFSGKRHSNVMEMSGSQTKADGTLHFRMSYKLNPDGTVRQLWQQSADQKKWETLFDGMYRRRN